MQLKKWRGLEIAFYFWEFYSKNKDIIRLFIILIQIIIRFRWLYKFGGPFILRFIFIHIFNNYCDY